MTAEVVRMNVGRVGQRLSRDPWEDVHQNRLRLELRTSNFELRLRLEPRELFTAPQFKLQNTFSRLFSVVCLL